jgi:pyruvate dehydrogenase E2 component (dihydrolipoamide acetyltransferase)
MTEGVIAAWHVKVGDTVSNGDLLAEVETDKATMDVESFFDGKVLHIGVAEGDGIPVGELLVVIGEEGEDVSSLISQYQNGGGSSESSAAEEAPAEKAPAKEQSAPAPEPVAVASQPAPKAPQGGSGAATAPVSNGSSHEGEAGRLKASPLAKAMAKDRGIDITQVQGSGESGRIVKRDIESFAPPAAQPAAAPQPAAQPAMQVATGQESYEEVRVSQMRKTVARRLADSKFTAPHFYVTMEIDMAESIAVRKKLNEISPVKISFNDMVIKAAAVALRQHPSLNSAWMGDKIRRNHHIHIGMAVAIEDGLLVPVIRFADSKGLSAIATESKSLAGKARSRELQPQEWEGNTFTVSNLGMFGVDEFTAIINPPDACILAIGGIIDKPIVKDGAVVPGKIMKVTLSCDHRVVDGAMGAAFLQTLKQLLEDPTRMLI